MQEQSRARSAGLTLPGEAHACDDSIHYLIIISVWEHDGRALAPKLKSHRHDVPARRTHDELPNIGRTGKGQLAYARIPGQRSSAFFSVAGNYVDNARWEVPATDLGQPQHSERCIFC